MRDRTGTAQSPASQGSQLTDGQRAAVDAAVRASTSQISFEQNVGQFPAGAKYGFKTPFGSMLVYDDHLQLLANQTDPATGATGVHAVNLYFTEGQLWEIVPGASSGVAGSYQQPDGTSVSPQIFKELTLRNVYQGIDLRLYSADNGVLEFDWLLAKAQDFQKIRIAATGQDGISFTQEGSATLDLRFQDLSLKMPEVYQVIDGQKTAVNAKMVAGDTAGEIRYQIDGNLVPDQPLVIDPNVVWATYFDLNDSSLPFDSYLFAVNANANGVYATGWTKETITNGSFGNYMQVNAGFSQGTANLQTYIYRLDSGGLNITAWTSTGVLAQDINPTNQKINGSNANGSYDMPADLELFPDGRVLEAFNSGIVQIYSANLATRSFTGEPVSMDSLNSVAIVNDNTFYASGRVSAAIPAGELAAAKIGPDATFAGGTLGLEGVIVRYSNAATTPTPDWATYVGGAGDEYFTTVALTPDKSKLVFATTTAVTATPGYPTLVNAVDTDPGAANTTELLVGVLPEQATVPGAFNVLSFLGGSGNEGTLAANTTAVVVTATDTFFYVGGNTASAGTGVGAFPGITGGAQTTNAGNQDAVISRISVAGGATGFQSTFLGGDQEEDIGGMAFDSRANQLLVFGSTGGGTFPVKNTSPASNYYVGAFGGGTWDIFVATYAPDLKTNNFATFIGGSSNDYLGKTGDLIGQGHVVYSDSTGLTYLGTTVHSSDIPANVIGTGATSPPGKDRTKSNGTNDTHIIFAFNINIFDYGDAPASYDNGNAAKEAISNTIRLGASTDAEAVPQNSANADGDDLLTSDDEDAITGTPATLAFGQTSYSQTVVLSNTSGSAKTLRGWIDFNRDGLFQAGEMASVSVPNNATSATLTWSGISGLVAGQSFMRLRFSDVLPTDDNATTNIDERSIGAGGNGEVEDYTLTISHSSVAGTVYRDVNNDGDQVGAGETGIDGVQVRLQGTDDLGSAVNLTTTTAGGGAFLFDNIRPSNAAGYTITEVTQPGGFFDGKDKAGSAGGTAANPPADSITTVVIGTNVAATGYLFGELPPSTLSGTIYRDNNNNGTIDAGETGIGTPTVTMTLSGTTYLGAPFSTTATTDANGNYTFTNLAPGTYSVSEGALAGFLDGKDTAGSVGGTPVNPGDTINSITLPAATAATGYNFGELVASTIAGTVYRDLNNNGAIDAGETGISGVSVTLNGTNDLGAAITPIVLTTDANGLYTFTGLRPGNYTITESQPANFVDGQDAAGTAGGTAAAVPGDAISGITLAANTAATGYRFGEIPSASLTGTVYHDLNANGSLDAGEPGISGVTITVSGTNDLGAITPFTVTTNGSGQYTVPNLRPGTYTLTETQPGAFLDGKESPGTPAGTVSNTVGSQTISTITLPQGTAGTGYNFGEVQASSVAGRVYNDLNNNGVFDAGEAGIGTVSVRLTGTDDMGQPVDVTVQTAAGTGLYTFPNLRPSNGTGYTITETQPGTFLDGKDSAGTAGGTAAAPVADNISGMVLGSAVTATGYNFGELTPGSLSGRVYNDVNNNGAIDAGDAGIAGVSVTLTGSNDLGTITPITVTTDANGNYTIPNLRPGTYVVTETQPAAFQDGKDTAGTSGGTAAVPPGDTITGVTLATGAAATGYNFGELTPSTLSGRVYHDLNANGVLDAGEVGISGVTITVSGTNDLGAITPFTVTTDANGDYTVPNLRPGTYTLLETQPGGFVDGKESPGTPAGTVSNALNSQTISNIPLPLGTAGTGYNFGEVQTGSLTGTVYHDLNNDGVLSAGESGINGVQLTLSGTDDLGQPVSLTATTNSSGVYTFGTVRPGSYTLTETAQPPGFLDGKDTAGSGVGGTAVNPGDQINGLTFTSGSTGSGYNFGELVASSIAGVVYRDNNNNGLVDAGETGISGVSMTLSGTNDLGAITPVTVTTDANGNYNFGNLRPGTYTVSEAQPGAFLDGQDTPGTAGGTAAAVPGDIISGIAIVSGTTATNYRFGELNPASLSGVVYAELNGNGTKDAFEGGIGGVTVTLTGSNDLGTITPIAVTTAADGTYSFPNLRPGNYNITETTQPAGYTDGTDFIGTGLIAPNSAGTAGNDVLSGITFLTVATGNNAGVNYNFSESPAFVLNKTLQSTSLLSTTGSNVAIGETATFRLVVDVPNGTFTDFQLQDLLPAGYLYVNGSAKAALVSTGGALSSSTLGVGVQQAPPVGSPTFTLPDAAVADNSTTNTDGYVSGTDVFFKFGTLTNTATTGTQSVVVEFTAVVVNETANQAGINLDNAFNVLIEKNGTAGPEKHGGNSNTVTTTVAEPTLTFTKGVAAGGTVSAGDTVTYTLTITNPAGANSATAFDALINDAMPADIRITAINNVALTGGVTTDTAAAITGGGTGLSGQFDIPVGGTVTITYTGTVQLSAAPGAAETNNATLTWTSINGNNSLTPDANERSGAATSLLNDGSLNDYRLVDSKTVTVGTASFDKKLFGTSDPATTGSNVGIGENVTYALVVTVPAGTAPSLSVVDTLPPGLQYVSSSVLTTAAGSNGLLTQDYNGTVPVPTVTGGAADGDDVTFNFGAITSAADGNANNNTFLILITAKVTNVGGNNGLPPGQTILPNSATFDIPGDGVPPTTPPPVNVTVVEPKLTIDKQLNVTQADAGDTVQITIVVNNTGTGPAHDVVVTDAVNTAKFGALTPITTPAGFVFNNASGTITYTGGPIAAGGSVTFVFSAKLLDTVNPSEILSNTATATATSEPGVVPGERSYGPVQDTETLTVNSVLNLVKSVTTPAGGTVKIGDVVTYQVQVTLVEGTTQNLSLVDALPAGMSFVAGSAVVSNANGMTVNGFAANLSGNTLTMSASSVVNPGNVDSTSVDSDTFTVTYQAVVNDVAGNASGTLLTNNLTGTGTGVPPTTPPPVTVTVAEPALKVTKAVNDATADLGQTLHFTLTISHTAASTADAFDILVRDALPAGLGGLANILVNGVAVGSSALVDTNASTASQLDLKLAQLALGGTITVEFDATVGTGASLVGTNIDNNARIYWDSQAAESPNSKLTGTPDSDADRDYGATAGYTEAPTPSPDDPAQDTERLTVNANTITGFVYRDVNANGVFDAGTDTPIQGVTVTLAGTTTFSQSIGPVTATTDATGAYIFNNVAPGTYSLTESQPSGFVDGIETAGNFGGTTNNALNADTIIGLTAPTGNGSGTGYNFGELLGSSLAGFTYNDANNDGVKQGAETGLGGLGITVTGTDIFGQAVSLSGTTTGAGAYSFTGLRPSNGAGYTITENDSTVVPATLLDGKDTVGTLNGTITGTVVGTSPKFDAINVVVAQNQTGANYNFAEVSKSSLSGNVYADLNNNGTFEPTFENGLPGVTITLTGTDDQGGAVNLTTTTNAAGAWSFAGLRPSGGSGYTITETQPANYTDGKDTLGTPGGTTGNDVFSAVIVTPGIAGANNNFGEQPDFMLSKTLVNTSNPGTTGNSVSVGEVATFRLVVTVPAGTFNNFQVEDLLPVGYAYVSGSAKAALVSTGGALSSSTLGAGVQQAPPVGSPGFTLPGAAVSTSIDAISGGMDVFFKFGNLANSDTNGATTESVVVEFAAQVTNAVGNQAGTNLPNTFQVLYERDTTPGPDPDPRPTPPTVTTTVAEPTLTFTKSVAAGGTVSAGDTVTYTLTITNPAGANSATAFDALVADAMPADIRITTIDNVAVAGGVTMDSAVAITGGGAGLSGQFDIPVGGTVTITYTGTVQLSAAPGAAETNNATLTWTSINGGNSLTPDAGERFGASTSLLNDGSLNDYRLIDSKTVTVGTASFDKKLFGTSDPATTGSNVGIGENVTYALVVTLPAGTAPSLKVVDTLPAGLQYVSSSVLTTAAGSNGLLVQDYNGTVPMPTVTPGASDVTFNFNAITATADGNANNNTFLILITARVADVGGNNGLPPGQTVLPNSAAFDIPGTPTGTPPPVNVTVVEPKLTIDKQLNVSQADAGDTVQITIVVNNTGTGPAHDVVVTDAVNTAKFGILTPITTPAGFVFNNASGTITYTGGPIAAGGSATFIFSAKLLDTVNPSEILSNTATATATSEPGVVPGERSYGPVQDTETLTVNSVLNLVKSVTTPAGGTVKIGDVVTYQVQVTLVEGTTQNLSLVDALPAGMSFVAGSAVVSNANGMTVNGFAANLSGNTLTMSASSVVNPGNVDSTSVDSDTFTVTYQAVVNDVAGNASGTLLTNNLTGTGTGVPPTTPPPVTVTVAEPALKVTKAVNDATADLGQTLHFTLTISHTAASTADAFDILVRDALPAGLGGLANILVNGVAVGSSALVDTNTSTASQLDLKLAQLALGGTITVEFDATVGTGASLVGTNIDNNARVYWDSQAAESPNSKLTGTPDSDADRDYGATAGYTEAPTPSPDDPAQDTERLTVNANSLTGFVYEDVNSSGTYNAGTDTPIQGVTVTLTGTTVFNQSITLTTTTDATGAYTFSNLAPGTYSLTETQPSGLIDGIETVGSLGGTKDDALNADTISGINILAGANVGTDYNFGELRASTLAGFVYLDANNDGIKQPSDSGLSGVPVTLTGKDIFGQTVSLTVNSGVGTGGYLFFGLRPSDGAGYTITEDDSAIVPGTYLDGSDSPGIGATRAGTGPKFDAINAVLGQNQTITSNNFAELAKSSLSGFVYQDLNNNGAKEAGESGQAGVTVTLSGTNDLGAITPIVVTTDSTGQYSFGDLRPGTYTITETQPPGLLDGTDTQGAPGNGTVVNDSFQNITLAPGADGANNNFGELPPSSFSGRVFNDVNNNGLFDPATDTGLPNVSVTLTGTSDVGAIAPVTVTTDANGNYTFTNLRPGTYAITETQPAGYLDGTDTPGTASGTLVAPDQINAIPLNVGKNETGYNFAELTPSSLSGKVYRDLDNDGVFDGGAETGVNGVTITLTGTDDRGVITPITVTTDANGDYSFGTLRPGSYTITETQPAGLNDGLDTQGTPGTGTTANDAFQNITLGTASNGANNNFGELPIVSITGTVFDDRNNNGLIESGEAGIPGAKVTITGTNDLGANINLVLTTDGNGNYDSGNLRPGTYTVTETQPAGFLDGTDSVGLGAGGTLGNDQITNIQLTATIPATGYNFGELTPSSLAGTVYRDLNNNGGVDGGEGGVPGVTVTLTGSDDHGAIAPIVLVTDGNGNYNFGNLRPGSYTITETQPSTLLDGKDTQGTPGNGTVANDAFQNIPLATATTGAGNNFGELTPATIAGRVYNDANNDGSDSGEAGVNGVTVNLTGTDDLGNSVTLSAVTTANGNYSFTGLRPGTYSLSEVQPAGLLDGLDTAGTPGGGAASNGAADADLISGIAITSGTSSAGNNFGELSPSSFSGTVYHDRNNNGVINSGEAFIANVTVTLTGTDDRGNAVNVSTTTDSSGNYSFGTLRPGTYTLTETQPANYEDGIDTPGTANGTAVPPDSIANITLGTGTAATGYNFGERGTVLTGTVWRDRDRDGVIDPGESGIGGVTITLLDASNSVVGTTTTAADGTYSFGQLAGGSYTVVETQPNGFGSSTPNSVASTIAPGGLNTVNFGETTGSLSGTVFRDDNFDGALNGSDGGLSGVTVRLTGTDVNGNSVNQTITTATDGTYVFNDLVAGTYTITETQPAGFLDGHDSPGFPAGGSNATNDVISNIVLGPQVDSKGYNFAELFNFNPSKSLISTDNPGTTGANVTIGETVRYRLVLDIPQTTMQDLVLKDLIPAGLQFVDDGTAAVAFVSNGNVIASSTLSGSGLAVTDINATPTFVLPSSAVSSAPFGLAKGFGNGTDVYFRLGDVTNADTTGATESIIIEFNARVTNTPGNQAGHTLENTFVPRYDTNGDFINDPLPPSIVSNPVRTPVVEPILTVDKQITSGPAKPKPGDVITYTVTIGHASDSGATAWETLFADQLPAGLQIVSVSTQANGGAVITQAASFTGAGTVTGQFDIPLGGSVTITYQVRVGAGVKAGTNLVNTADVTWSSAQGDTPVERKSGDSLLNKGGLNDYELKAQAQITTGTPPPTDMFQYFYDGFNVWHNKEAVPDRIPAFFVPVSSPDIFRGPILPLAPIYSGEADPGATLVLTMYNANGEEIGMQTVVVDAGGNWMATFESTVMRDYPSTVRISQQSAYYSLVNAGHNLRAYFSPALNPGHFFLEASSHIEVEEKAPLLGDLGVSNPFSLGPNKYNGEVLSTQGVAGGY